MFNCTGSIDDTIPEGIIAYTDKIEKIFINNEPKTRDSLISAIMHEVCHISATRQGKYKTYHKVDNMFSKKEIYAYKKTALNAEIYVDTWAERLTKTYFPHVKYERSYRTSESRQRLKKEVNDWAEDVLKLFDIL